MEIKRKVFRRWLKTKGLSDETLYHYCYYFKAFDYPDFSQETVNEFTSRKFNNNVSRAFIKNLKEFIIAHREELKLSEKELNEVKGVELPRITGRKARKLIRTVSEDEARKIVQVMNSERNKLMVLLIFYSGLRIGEFLRIRPLDFNWAKFDEDQEAKPCQLKVFGKGGKEGIALVEPRLARRVRKYINNVAYEKIENNEPIFWPPKRDTWEDIFAKYSRLALGSRKNVHALRHGFATHLFSKGVDIRIIKDFMRHSDISSTDIYTHVNQEQLEDKYSEVFS